MPKLRRIQITHVHPADAHYHSRHKYIGAKGEFEPWMVHLHPGYYAGDFRPDNQEPNPSSFFIAVRYKKI
jgi:hypothetical protein